MKIGPHGASLPPHLELHLSSLGPPGAARAMALASPGIIRTPHSRYMFSQNSLANLEAPMLMLDSLDFREKQGQQHYHMSRQTGDTCMCTMQATNFCIRFLKSARKQTNKQTKVLILSPEKFPFHMLMQLLSLRSLAMDILRLSSFFRGLVHVQMSS